MRTDSTIQNSLTAPRKEGFALIVSLEGLRVSQKVRTIFEENSDIRMLFDLVIIDEAHYLRNSNTKSFQFGELLRDVSNSFLLLSATPIQTGSDNFFNLLRLLSDEEFNDQNVFEARLRENIPLVRLTTAIDENDDINLVHTYLSKTISYPSYLHDSDINFVANNIDNIMHSTEARVEAVSKLKSKYFYDSFITRTRKRDVIENRTERKVAAINYPLSPIESEVYSKVTQYLREKGDKNNLFNNFGLIMRQRQMASCMPAALDGWRRANLNGEETGKYD